MEIHHPSVIFAKPAPEPQQQQQQLQDSQLPQESQPVFSNSSSEGLLAADPVFSPKAPAGTSTTPSSDVCHDPLPSFNSAGVRGNLAPLPSFSSTVRNSSLANFNPNGSTDNIANPLVSQSVDFLSEDAVFESILSGEPVSSQPSTGQDSFR
jgi:hypothetical protein